MKLGALEDESSLFQNRQKEEFILFMTEMLCVIGAMITLVIGVDSRDSDPNAMLISMVVMFLLIGFAFERGALNSQMPSILREKIWWIGPIAFLGILLIQLTIEGNLLTLTFYDIELLSLLSGSWIVGAGLKRLLVRGRFGEAYSGMLARKGDSIFQLSRGIAAVWIAVMVLLNAFVIIFDYEDFPDILSTTVIYTIIFIGCTGFKTRDKTVDGDRSSDFNERAFL